MLSGACATMNRAPQDQPNRDRIEHQFDRTFLVEAGAGSGKTKCLSARIAAGIAAGAYDVENVAAVTFTRKAAAELRGRLQLALEDQLRKNPSAAEQTRIEGALANIERLFTGTIHSFCARLLRERPVESCIAPDFVEVDDVEDQRRRGQSWRDFIASERGKGSSLMVDLQAAGVRPFDLDGAFGVVCDHDEVDFPAGDAQAPDPAPAWSQLLAFWKALSKYFPDPIAEASTCKVQEAGTDFGHRLEVARVGRAAVLADLLATWEGDFATTKKWWGDGQSKGNPVAETVDELLRDFRTTVIVPWLQAWREYVYRIAIGALIAARESYRADRRRENVVNYTDLLSATARLLREQPLVRQDLRAKYRWLFVDEFQDTDPIQAEILLLLAADEASIVMRGCDVDLRTVRLRPGALFIVGDPKQSIYRFRRADIDVYNAVRDVVVGSGGELLTLTASWRSLPEVCALANSVFPRRFPVEPTPETPKFEPLDAVRRSPSPEAPGLTTGILRLTVPLAVIKSQVAVAEADRIATYIKAEVAAGRRHYRDFLVLTRATPRLGVYAAACERLEIPVEVSGAGRLLESAEVATLSLLLRCLGDPLDALSLVGVLRGPLFGLGDQELFAYRQTGGRFDIRTTIRDESAAERTQTDPVRSALGHLNQLYRLTRTLPAAAAIERILEQTGLLALAATKADGARAGELLQAIDLVRQVVELGGSLADGAAALDEDASISSEMESLPLEPGRRDVVRVMNLHKAKGLEANVVFLADPCHGYVFPASVRIIREGSVVRGYLRIEWRAEEGFARRLIGLPVGWTAHESIEQRYIAAETNRLLYVAATRARDLLVVGRWANTAPHIDAWPAFSLFVRDCPELRIPDVPARSVAVLPDCSAVARAAAMENQKERHQRAREPSWATIRVTDEAQHQGATPRIREALNSEPGVPALTGPQSASVLQDTTSHRADTGYAWGWLIHGLLEHAMRKKDVSRPDLERLAGWLVVEFPDLRPFIGQAVDVVEGVFGAAFWQHARAAGECQVEVPFAARSNDSSGLPTVVRGVIDLVYGSQNGWRIVDYKTDQAVDAGRMLKYSNQVTDYGAAWSRVTSGSSPHGSIFLVRTGRIIDFVAGGAASAS